MDGSSQTVGFLYGAGAETLILGTGRPSCRRPSSTRERQEKRYKNIHGKSLLKYTEEEEGQNFPIFISCHYLVELGPGQLGLLVADIFGDRRS